MMTSPQSIVVLIPRKCFVDGRHSQKATHIVSNAVLKKSSGKGIVSSTVHISNTLDTFRCHAAEAVGVLHIQ